jgi:nitrate/nitrite transporter NarK
MATRGQKSSKVFYGWWIVLVAGIGLSVHAAPIVTFTFGVFLKSFSQEFSWSRGQASLAVSLSTLGIAVAAPFLGRLVDRFGARRVILPSTLLFGVGVLSLYFLSAHLWHFYAIFLFLGVLGSGTTAVPYSKVISRWFDRQRGLALGLALVGASVGISAMPSVAQALITSVGWRSTYVVLGLLTMGITLPVVGRFLTETPQQMGLWPDGAASAAATVAKTRDPEPGFSSREARHTATFWVLVSAAFLVSASFVGCLIHLVPLLTDRGVSAQNAALATSVGAGGALLARAGTGYLLDRFFVAHVALPFFCGSALGILLLWSGVVGGLAFVAAVLVGLGQGAEFDILPYAISRYFGLRAFGEIYGYTFAAVTLGAAVGPLVMGVSFDATGSYSLALISFAVATFTAAGLMIGLGPYRVWEPVAEPVVAADILRA